MLSRLSINIIVIIVVFILGNLFNSLIISSDKNKPEYIQKNTPKANEQSQNIDITKLTEVNIELKRQISYLSTLVDEQVAKTAEDKNSVKQVQLHENEQGDDRSFTQMITPEFIKESVKFETNMISSELVILLGLDKNQAEELKVILEEKVEKDIDVNSDLITAFTKNSTVDVNSDTFDNSSEQLERKRELKEIQSEFERRIAGLLTDEQVNKFREYEASKMGQQEIFAHSMRETMLKQEIPSLDEYQQEQISRFFAENKPKVKNVKLGSSVNSFPLGGGFSNNEFEGKLMEQLSQILTEEQQAAYNPFYESFVADAEGKVQNN